MKSTLRIAPLFLFSCLAAFLLMQRSIVVYDEGIELTGAMRVLSGDVIHRDFYANYGPGQFYALAGLFEVFGHSVLVERWWDIVVRSAIVVCIYLLLAPRTRPTTTWIATLVCGAWLWSIGHPSYPVYPALLLSLVATLLLLRSLATANIRLMAGAGACVAGATLFRYDVGFFALCGLTVGMVAWSRSSRDASDSARLVPELKALLGTACGLVLLLLLIYAGLGALPDFLFDVVFFPSDNYARTRGLPFPSPARLLQGAAVAQISVYLPLLSCLGGAYALWATQGSDEKRGTRMLAFLLLPLVVSFYLKSMVRVSVDHVQLSLLPSIALLALAWELSPRRVPQALLVVLWALNVVAAWECLDERAGEPDITARRLSQAGFGVLAMDMEYAEPYRARAVQYLAQNAAPGERVFIGLMRHDRIFINDASAYFTSGHLPATKWHQFDPGLQNAAYTQAEMVKELRTHPPSYAWVESTFERVREPNASANSSGVFLLDNYLHRAYEPVQGFGPILILKLKPGLAASPEPAAQRAGS
jgi:hypothetical protein